jgi:transcriptional regulator with XRE-family HTH domain
VQPDEIQKLRKELSCTAKELAGALGVDPKEVSAWEAGELFPTKRYVTAMAALRAKGPTAIVRAPRGKAVAKTGQARLADPVLWRLVRKLVEHPALFDQVVKLSEAYADPAEPTAPVASKSDG